MEGKKTAEDGGIVQSAKILQYKGEDPISTPRAHAFKEGEEGPELAITELVGWRQADLWDFLENHLKLTSPRHK